MAGSFLYKTLCDVLDGKYTEEQINELKLMLKKDHIFTEYTVNVFGIILSKSDIKLLFEQCPDKFVAMHYSCSKRLLPTEYCMKKILECDEDTTLATVTDTDVATFEETDSLMDDDYYDSFASKVSHFLTYNTLCFEGVCCNKETVVISGDFPILYETYLQIKKEVIPDVEFGVLNKLCRCTY